MKVVFDTNVVLDSLLERPQYFALATELLKKVEQRRVVGGLCATTVTTLDYLLVRSLPASVARSRLTDLLDLFEIARVDSAVIRRALLLRSNDFEDVVLAESARFWGAHAIVSRDVAGFRNLDGLQHYTPTEFLSLPWS